MVELLVNKNAATRFQVLIEIAASGPVIQQKDIAARLMVTPQAVSDYIGQLEGEDFLVSTARSRYSITSKGVNWMLKALRELRDYVSRAQKAVNDVSVSAAVAESDLTEGQPVGLIMQDGLLLATPRESESSRGIAMTGARAGDDVGVVRIEGLVKLSRGTVKIVTVPDIRHGGSRAVDLTLLKKEAAGQPQTGAIGIEALIALRRAGIEPAYFYNVPGTAAEATRHGLPFFIACSEDELTGLLGQLHEADVKYLISELGPKKKGR